MAACKLGLFNGLGIEIEYMIVSRKGLSIMPIADKLLFSVQNGQESDVIFGKFAWSNELVLHVIELKTMGPAKTLAGLSEKLQENVNKMNSVLEPMGAMLLPSGAHPFMDPLKETKLWPYGDNTIYKAYDRIFGCKGHGWSNLQSTHMNISFGSGDEFARLHSAVRLLLPILPALSASSPILEGKFNGRLDSRLDYYAKNQSKVPSISGSVIPEGGIRSVEDYKSKINGKIYRDIAPYDKEGILRHEWLNSRGTVPKFERSAIEIRTIDSQECVSADLAIFSFALCVLKALTSEKTISLEKQISWPDKSLVNIYQNVLQNGQGAVIKDKDYLEAFGCFGRDSCTARELLSHINGEFFKDGNKTSHECIGLILSQGTLSERILKSLNGNLDRQNIVRTYKSLAMCLAEGRMFRLGDSLNT